MTYYSRALLTRGSKLVRGLQVWSESWPTRLKGKKRWKGARLLRCRKLSVECLARAIRTGTKISIWIAQLRGHHLFKFLDPTPQHLPMCFQTGPSHFPSMSLHLFDFFPSSGTPSQPSHFLPSSLPRPLPI